MVCVILAAGKNVRLDNGIPKSLITVDGQNMLDRHFKMFPQVGVKKFCVVVGARAEMIRDHISEYYKNDDLEIEIVMNHHFEKENGYSLLAANDFIEKSGEENFLFTMADHYYDIAFLHKFINQTKGTKKTLLELAVDIPSDSNKHIDLEDVTKVNVKNELIEEIGKELTNYNYYDTGLFYVNKSVTNYLKNSIDIGKSSISNMVHQLILEKQAGIMDVSGEFWNDIDTPEDLETTLKIIKK
jgi:choline kinase